MAVSTTLTIMNRLTQFISKALHRGKLLAILSINLSQCTFIGFLIPEGIPREFCGNSKISQERMMDSKAWLSGEHLIDTIKLLLVLGTKPES